MNGVLTRRSASMTEGRQNRRYVMKESRMGRSVSCISYQVQHRLGGRWDWCSLWLKMRSEVHWHASRMTCSNRWANFLLLLLLLLLLLSLSLSLSPDVILCGWLGSKHQLTYSVSVSVSHYLIVSCSLFACVAAVVDIDFFLCVCICASVTFL